MTSRQTVQQPMALCALQRANVPEKLTEQAQWVCWKFIPDPSRPKPKKVPICPATGQFAAANDPSTWGTFDEAAACYEKGDGDGLGFMFTAGDPYCGIDLDDCIDQDTGTLSEASRVLIDRLNSYTEFSPSGNGIHVIVEAKLPGKGRKRGGTEIYDRLRYFTVTGDALPSRVRVIHPAQEVVAELYEQLRPPKKATGINRDVRALVGPELPDEAILELIRASRFGAWFRSVYEGRGRERYNSQSEADLALTGLLATFVGNNPTQIDRLFRASALYRPKWDEQRGEFTYGELTIQKAVGEQS